MHLKQRRIQAAGDFRGAEPGQGNLPADSRHSSRGHFQFRRLPSHTREERERLRLFDFKELVRAWTFEPLPSSILKGRPNFRITEALRSGSKLNMAIRYRLSKDKKKAT